MANSLGINLINRKILVKEAAMKQEFRAEKDRIAIVLGGFGAHRDTLGRCIFVKWDSDKVIDKIDGYDIEKALD